MSMYSESLQWSEEDVQAAGPEPSYEEMGYDEPDINVGLAERIASALAGVALIGGGIYVASKRRPISTALMGLGAGMLLKRGITGQCGLYTALGVSTAESPISSRLARPVSVEESVTIERPAEDLYAYWRDFKNLPRIMRHLERVDIVDDRKSHWVAQGPAGQLIEWEAVITHERPNELIAWESTENAVIPNKGSVRFRPASGHLGTIVDVMLEYEAPGGALGAGIAKLFHREPSQEIREDLREFKAFMEAGEKSTFEGQQGSFGSGI